MSATDLPRASTARLLSLPLPRPATRVRSYRAEPSIGMVTQSLSRRGGGLFHSVRRIAQTLSEKESAVSVYGPLDDETATDIGAWLPIRPEIFPSRGPRAFRYTPGLVDALAGHDIIHQHGLWTYASVATSAARRRTGQPVMISPRGMLDGWALNHSRHKKALAAALFERANLRAATCLHALSMAEIAAFRAYGLDNPVALIPNGVDLPPSAPDFDLGHPPFGPDQRRTLLFIGRIHPKKGLAALIDGFARLRRDCAAIGAGWRLVIGGWDDGGHLAGLRQRVAAHGMDGSVSFPGPLFGRAKDIALRSADAFVLPSHSEGMPMGVLEASAYGLPVIMTRACNIPELLAGGAAYEITTAPETMAPLLAAALAADDLAARGRAGRRIVERQFTWTRVARTHAEIYRWMADGGPPPACLVFA